MFLCNVTILNALLKSAANLLIKEGGIPWGLLYLVSSIFYKIYLMVEIVVSNDVAFRFIRTNQTIRQFLLRKQNEKFVDSLPSKVTVEGRQDVLPNCLK